MPLTVELVSPEDILYTGEADMVITRTVGGGDIAFMAGHVPFIGSLEICAVAVHETDGNVARIAVHRGFVSMSNDKVSVLSDTAEMADDIDGTRAQRALDEARSAVAANGDDEEAKANLRRAEIRLEVAGLTPTT